MKNTNEPKVTFPIKLPEAFPKGRGGLLYFVAPALIEADGIKCITYGIAAVSGGVMVDCVLDISSDFAEIKNLVTQCNRHKLSLSHLMDIAEDAVIS